MCTWQGAKKKKTCDESWSPLEREAVQAARNAALKKHVPTTHSAA